MSLFHSTKPQLPKSATFQSSHQPDLLGPEISDIPIVKKKRTFFRGHAKSDSVSSLKDIMVVPREVTVTPLPPHSAKETVIHHPHLGGIHAANHESGLPASPRRSASPRRRSSTTRRLQKRPPSHSGGSSRASPNGSPAQSPNYVFDKPPRISSKDYIPAHQNLYIMDDGQDDEMYTLFEMISGNKPMNYNGNSAQSQSSAYPSPDLPMDSQRCELKRTKKANAPTGHSRNTSASSEYSVMSTSTYQTEFSDFQFEFNGANPLDKEGTLRGAPQEFTFPRKAMTAPVGKVSDLLGVEMTNDYEDCVASIADLTSDDESDYSFEHGDDLDDLVLEEGLAIQVQIRKYCSPILVIISPRSSCEL